MHAVTVYALRVAGLRSLNDDAISDDNYEIFHMLYPHKVVTVILETPLVYVIIYTHVYMYVYIVSFESHPHLYLHCHSKLTSF